MIKTFLEAKHWQLFGLTVGIPLLFLSSLVSGGDQVVFRFVFFMPLSGVILLLVLYGWFWSVGVGLQKKIPQDLRLNVKFFKWTVIFPFIYITLILGTLSYAFSSDWDYIEQYIDLLDSALFIILPIHYFTLFCLFYQLYFVSKTIKTMELQRKVTFGDYIGELVLVLLFPIGIWFVQPKINKFAQSDYMVDEDDYIKHIL